MTKYDVHYLGPSGQVWLVLRFTLGKGGTIENLVDDATAAGHKMGFEYMYFDEVVDE